MSNVMIETISSGYRFAAAADAPSKRWSDDIETTPLRQREPGEYCYAKVIPGSDFIYVKVLGEP